MADETGLIRTAVFHTATQSLTDGDNANQEVDAAGRILTADVSSEATVFASQEFAEGANNSADQTNLYARGFILTLDYTAESGTNPTIDVKVQVKDGLSSKYVDLAGAAFAQKNAVGTFILTVYPGVAESGNVSVSDIIPLTWRVVATVGGTGTPTVTASLGVSYVR